MFGWLKKIRGPKEPKPVYGGHIPPRPIPPPAQYVSTFSAANRLSPPPAPSSDSGLGYFAAGYMVGNMMGGPSHSPAPSITSGGGGDFGGGGASSSWESSSSSSSSDSDSSSSSDSGFD